MLGKFLLIFFVILVVLGLYNVPMFGVDFFVDSERSYNLKDLTGYQST